MTFVKINGYTIPTKQGGQAFSEEIGTRRTMYDGSRKLSVRDIKRDIQLATVRANELRAESYRGAILGLGQHFPLTTDMYSSSGLFPSVSNGMTFMDNASDGDPVYTAWRTAASTYVFSTESYFGNGSVGAATNTVNLLDADARDAENAPTGYGAIGGGALAADTTNYWQETKSLEATATLTVDGAGLNPTYNPGVGSSGNTYTFSCYAKGDSGGEQITCWLYDVTNANGSSNNFTLTDADTWYRIQVTHTLTADSASLDCRILSANGAMVFYCDGWQLEEQNVMTPWVDGTRASVSQTRYSYYNTKKGGTVCGWTLGPNYDSAIGRNLFWWMNPTYRNGIMADMNFDSGNNNIKIYVYHEGVHTNACSETGLWDGSWHHIAVVWNRTTETGEYYCELFVDGSSASTPSVSRTIENDLTISVIGGAQGGSYAADSILEDFVFAPFAMTSDQISGIYNLGKAMSPLPEVYVTGNVISETERTMLGEIKGETYEPYYDGNNSVWRDNARSYAFRLWER